MLSNLTMQGFLAAIRNDSSADFSATLHDAEDRGFVFAASCSNPAMVFIGVHEASCTANESFVYFHFTTGTAEFHKGTILHSEPDAVEHEPCRLLSDSKVPGYFIGTDTVLAVGDKPDSHKPLVERQRGILKDGSHLDGELPLRVDTLALPLALILEEHGILTSTSGAGHSTVGPAEFDHEFQAVIGVREVDNGLLESLWFGAHCVPHKPNSSPARLICQVYYCLRKSGRERA